MVASLKDPCGVLGGAVLRKVICQKCGHELACNLIGYDNIIFDKSSTYCLPC